MKYMKYAMVLTLVTPDSSYPGSLIDAVLLLQKV